MSQGGGRNGEELEKEEVEAEAEEEERRTRWRKRGKRRRRRMSSRRRRRRKQEQEEQAQEEQEQEEEEGHDMAILFLPKHCAKHDHFDTPITHVLNESSIRSEQGLSSAGAENEARQVPSSGWLSIMAGALRPKARMSKR